MNIKSAIRLVLLLAMFGGALAVTTGCLPILRYNAVLSANPQIGMPSFFDGGMFVTFSSNGIIKSIDYGDGIIGTSNTHTYTQIGTYKAVSEILVNGITNTASTTITVQNDPPTVYPAFVAGSYAQERSFMLLDAGQQQHGCGGAGAPAENFGAWPRYGEELFFSWEVIVVWPDRDELIVYGDGSPELPLSLIRWHIGSPYRMFPDWYPVPTIDGIWIPSNYTPMDVCPPIVDPWVDYPDTSKTAIATIKLTAFNQFGSWATSTNIVDVYVNGGCD